MSSPEQKSPFGADQRQALGQIVEHLRQLIEHSVSLNADTATLNDWAGQLGELAGQWAAHGGQRGLEQYNRDPGEDLNSILPTSPITGDYNPLAPPVRMRREGGRLLGEVSFGRAYEGPPDCVHGALVAAVYDQLLAVANALNGSAGPTARLDVEYLRPTPLEQPLVFSAWVERQEGRKVTVLGECHAGDQLVSRCSSLFIQFMG